MDLVSSGKRFLAVVVVSLKREKTPIDCVWWWWLAKSVSWQPLITIITTVYIKVILQVILLLLLLQ